jgi:hypothetical protein
MRSLRKLSWIAAQGTQRPLTADPSSVVPPRRDGGWMNADGRRLAIGDRPLAIARSAGARLLLHPSHFPLCTSRNPDTFPRQQRPFPIQPAGKAAEPVVRGQHAMAGHENRNGIGPARAADGANGPGVSNRAGDFGITAGLTARNFPERAPNALLKIRAGGEIERRQFAGRPACNRAPQSPGGGAMPVPDLRRC